MVDDIKELGLIYQTINNVLVTSQILKCKVDVVIVECFQAWKVPKILSQMERKPP